MKYFFLFIFLTTTFYAYSQDDLLSKLQDDEPTVVSYLFKGTKVVNGQSVEIPAQEELQFIIQHRFGTINSGSYNFFGLDNSQIRIGLDYGIKNWASVGIGRSSALKTIDANMKVKIKQQSKGSNEFPATIVANSAVYLKQWKWEDADDESFLLTNQLSFVHQLLVARKLSRDFTVQVSPTLVHYNLVETKDEPNDKYAVGLGVREKITKRISANAEYFYQINDPQNNNVLSIGFDIETGGHVFQLHFSNSPAMIEPHFITQTTGNWLDGDIYFGFNISRIFSFTKK